MDITTVGLDNKGTDRQAAERLQTLFTVQEMLKQVQSESLNIHIILPEVLQLAVRQLGAADGSIIVVNQALEIDHASFAHGNPSENFIGDIMNRGLAGWVIRSKQPYVINDTRHDEHWLPRPGHATTSEPWSVICTPFIIRDRAVGAITLHKPGVQQFDTQDLNLLLAISTQAASTIENARLFEQSQRQLQVSALLYEASKVINSSLDINEIMQLLLNQMNELLNAEAISIALVEKSTDELIYQVSAGIGSEEIKGLRLPSHQGISGWVMRHNKPVLVTDAAKDDRFNSTADERTGHRTRAMICAPIHSKGEVLGTIQAINPTKTAAFTRQDLDLLINLANIASSAIANAQQFARTQAAEARYTNLFQDSIDPIVLTDLHGRIIEANQNAFEFFGYRRKELLARHIHDLHPPKAHLPDLDSILPDNVLRVRTLALKAPQQSVHVEVYVKRTATGFDQGDVLQWIHHDISQQVELEQMREDLTAMLFHDLQSPLGNVISSLELMRYEITDPLLLSMLDIATRSSHRLQTLVRSLLDINQLEAGHPVRTLNEVEPHTLFDFVWEVEEPNFQRRGIAFRQQVEPNLPHLKIDEDMIRRVLINLVDNAVKHSQDSQAVTVIARRPDPPDDSRLLLIVQDEGIGVPVAFRTKIFAKFERIKKETGAKGLGLGLAFCRLAVEAHGGRIWVDDAPGGGARFNFTLPIAQPDAE
ncbi:MAG: GAF domain-containing protein [Anaerolineales bacterium]|nr:GAF domain-containing protein [Anaerolineales bacterium]